MLVCSRYARGSSCAARRYRSSTCSMSLNIACLNTYRIEERILVCILVCIYATYSCMCTHTKDVDLVDNPPFMRNDTASCLGA